MDRATEFILLYNKLSDHVYRITGEARTKSFAEVAFIAAKQDTSLLAVIDDVREFGQLRNAIIHDREYPTRVIAEPTAETMDHFSAIVRRVLAPRRLVDFQVQVRVFTTNSHLLEALTYMGSHDYSQIVVRRQQTLALLTTEGIARWLQAQAHQDPLVLTNIQLGDVLGVELADNYVVMSLQHSIDDAHHAFRSAIERGQPRLYAIILTSNGKPTAQPVGIVTPWDLLE